MEFEKNEQSITKELDAEDMKIFENEEKWAKEKQENEMLSKMIFDYQSTLAP